MNDLTTIPPAHLVVLSRLLTGGTSGTTGTQLGKDVAPLLGEGEAGRLKLERALVELQGNGLVERSRRGKIDRASLTEAGRSLTLAGLGLEALPPKTTWAKVKSSYLSARALGIVSATPEAARRLGTKSGFEGALLRVRFELTVGEMPTAAQATDALLWKLLGVSSPIAFSLPNVKRWLLNKALGETESLDAPKALRRLIVRSIGARRDSQPDLREAALRHWLAGAAVATTEPEHTPAPLAEPAPLPAVLDFEPPPDGGREETPLNLADFAHQVLEATATSPTGRFGASRVFISHVWEAMRGRPWFSGLTLDVFKRFLIEANQARLLDLGRADLVEAMDPLDVRASETSHLGATFHFIRLGGPPP